MKWYDKLFAELKKWFSKKYPDVTPKPEPEKPVEPATPVEPTSANASEASQGFTHPTVITDNISYIRHNEGNIYFTNPRLNWSSSELVGEAQMAVKQDGAWSKPKKLDHIRSNTSSRDWLNIVDGYQGWVEPAVGAPCAFLLISYDKKKRTNAIFFNWK